MSEAQVGASCLFSLVEAVGICGERDDDDDDSDLLNLLRAYAKCSSRFLAANTNSAVDKFDPRLSSSFHRLTRAAAALPTAPFDLVVESSRLWRSSLDHLGRGDGELRVEVEQNPLVELILREEIESKSAKSLFRSSSSFPSSSYATTMRPFDCQCAVCDLPFPRRQSCLAHVVKDHASQGPMEHHPPYSRFVVEETMESGRESEAEEEDATVAVEVVEAEEEAMEVEEETRATSLPLEKATESTMKPNVEEGFAATIKERLRCKTMARDPPVGNSTTSKPDSESEVKALKIKTTVRDLQGRAPISKTARDSNVRASHSKKRAHDSPARTLNSGSIPTTNSAVELCQDNWTCIFCSKSFLGYVSARRHRIDFHKNHSSVYDVFQISDISGKERIYKCSFCPCRFENRKELTSHYRDTHWKILMNDAYYDKVNKQEKNKHSAVSYDKWLCKFCNTTYSGYIAARDHRRRRHKKISSVYNIFQISDITGEERVYKCFFCHFVFILRQELTIHYKHSHSKDLMDDKFYVKIRLQFDTSSKCTDLDKKPVKTDKNSCNTKLNQVDHDYWNCRTCKKRYYGYNAATWHKYRCHKSRPLYEIFRVTDATEEDRIYKCSKCSSTYKTRPGLSNHYQSAHGRLYMNDSYYPKVLANSQKIEKNERFLLGTDANEESQFYNLATKLDSTDSPSSKLVPNPNNKEQASKLAPKSKETKSSKNSKTLMSANRKIACPRSANGSFLTKFVKSYSIVERKRMKPIEEKILNTPRVSKLNAKIALFLTQNYNHEKLEKRKSPLEDDTINDTDKKAGVDNEADNDADNDADKDGHQEKSVSSITVPTSAFGKFFVCPLCDKVFQGADGRHRLIKHKLRYHKKSRSEKKGGRGNLYRREEYQCTICGEIEKNAKAFQKHLRVHGVFGDDSLDRYCRQLVGEVKGQGFISKRSKKMSPHNGSDDYSERFSENPEEETTRNEDDIDNDDKEPTILSDADGDDFFDDGDSGNETGSKNSGVESIVGPLAKDAVASAESRRDFPISSMTSLSSRKEVVINSKSCQTAQSSLSTFPFISESTVISSQTVIRPTVLPSPSAIGARQTSAVKQKVAISVPRSTSSLVTSLSSQIPPGMCLVSTSVGPRTFFLCNSNLSTLSYSPNSLIHRPASLTSGVSTINSLCSTTLQPRIIQSRPLNPNTLLSSQSSLISKSSRSDSNSSTPVNRGEVSQNSLLSTLNSLLSAKTPRIAASSSLKLPAQTAITASPQTTSSFESSKRFFYLCKLCEFKSVNNASLAVEHAKKAHQFSLSRCNEVFLSYCFSGQQMVIETRVQCLICFQFFDYASFWIHASKVHSQIESKEKCFFAFKKKIEKRDRTSFVNPTTTSSQNQLAHVSVNNQANKQTNVMMSNQSDVEPNKVNSGHQLTVTSSSQGKVSSHSPTSDPPTQPSVETPGSIARFCLFCGDESPKSSEHLRSILGDLLKHLNSVHASVSKFWQTATACYVCEEPFEPSEMMALNHYLHIGKHVEEVVEAGHMSFEEVKTLLKHAEGKIKAGPYWKCLFCQSGTGHYDKDSLFIHLSAKHRPVAVWWELCGSCWLCNTRIFSASGHDRCLENYRHFWLHLSSGHNQNPKAVLFVLKQLLEVRPREKAEQHSD